MDYSWNLVKWHIERLESLFSSLSEIFGKQKIVKFQGCTVRISSLSKLLEIHGEQDEHLSRILEVQLRKKSVEWEKLLKTLAEMVDNFEKRYKVDYEEKQDEGGALDDEEKQHERSLLELKKHERIVLELWLEELQEAVFNTEDLVDKIHTVAYGQLSEKMEDIRRCIESYVKAGDVLGLAGRKYKIEQLESQRQLLGTTDYIYFVDELDPIDYNYFVDKSEVFGMDRDKEEIIKILLSDDANDKQLPVISIVGNGRIGKTTLARLVYNEQGVSDHFHRKAWVDVPDDFDWVIKSILKFLTWQNNDLKEKYNDLDKLELEQLGFKLQNYLKGKRFLLVLDGVKRIPSSKGWEALRSAFQFAANGSRIIVTTRNKDIAPMMDAVNTYHMEPSEERSWSIFAEYAFGGQNPTPDTQLEVIGKEIVQMCHGLPSSVRILGSLLRFKLQQEEWEAILKRLKPSSDSREDSRENVNVVPNLRLPEDLKRCLAYCSIFPPDYEFEMEKLVLLCMAEGFLKPHSNSIWETVKEVSNIIELEPFFQKSSHNESSFRMCMNNLAAYVSTRYCFRLEDNHPSEMPLNTRYLSLVGGKYENSVIFEAIDRAKRLRTFLPLDHESRHLRATELQNLLSKLQFLRVLSLSHYHITEIPDSIGNLEHLRYIDLSHTPIKRLPESVCELHNLQSLILSNCHSLTKLPENTSKLVNLLNLDVSGSGLSEMPRDMDKLRNLRLLPCFIVGKKSGSLIELKDINCLEGTLHILKLQNVTSENVAHGTPLVDKRSIEELVLEWDENTADPENARKVLAGLRPSYSLKRLTINFYCSPKFPSWLDGKEIFNEMVFLRLSNCNSCSTLPSLGKLQKLRVLIIECMDAVEEVGPDFNTEPPTRMHRGFRYLERLTFEGMSKWTKWVPSNVLPCLQQLCIRRCPKLRGNLPKELPSVERIEISESQELVTALTTEASLNNLHYREKIVFLSDDEVTSFTSEGATGSSSPMIEDEKSPFPLTQGAPESLLPSADGVVDTSVPITKVSKRLRETPETEGRGESEEETGLEITKTSETKRTKVERKEVIEVDPFPSPFSDEKSSLPLTQSATTSSFPTAEGVVDEKSSFPLTQGAAESLLPSAEGVVDTSVPTTQATLNKKLKEMSETKESGESEEADVLSDTWSNSSFESMKVSEISELMALLTPLHSLKIDGCDNLTFIPKSVIKNPSLQHLYIINCCSLESFFYEGMALKILYIRNCKKLYFPLTNENIQLDKLEDLSVGSSCDSLTDLSLHLFPELRSLSIWDCAKLQKLSMPEKSQIELTSLEALEIRDCPNLEYFPTGGLPTPNLKSIWCSNCKSLKKLPDQLGTLEYLTSMFINDCPELESLSKQVLPSKLSLLRISSCNKLISGKKWGLHGLASLCLLEIEGECKNVESFPVEGLLPSNLSSLCISGLLDLKKLDNTGLKKLESLKTLEISSCRQLQSLPEDGFPSSLSFLCIKECPLLEPKLQNKNGEDWYKIAHISCIEIDEEVIS
ncbi:putative disease resistance protein At3g14460 isoform X3 [Quercus robur]|uniref:putative disease resistance protein At3g14460 isoform X3 n=1 Tax=Quercus robur TaxID=38942 RepID=UPI002162A206|nr:putative disease resistance protein At3g14460 isoform X3 [Quercus robur]